MGEQQLSETINLILNKIKSLEEEQKLVPFNGNKWRFYCDRLLDMQWVLTILKLKYE